MNHEGISNQIKKLKNWKREMDKAMAPFNSELKYMAIETFKSHPELTELRFTLCGSNYIAKRDDYMND